MESNDRFRLRVVRKSEEIEIGLEISRLSGLIRSADLSDGFLLFKICCTENYEYNIYNFKSNILGIQIKAD